MNALSVSVIVPVYNGAATLGDTLRSLRDSSCRPGQIIVVDDGSTDASARIAEEFGVTVLSTRGRCGPAVARGIGAEEATGTVLLFLDSDVCVHPGTPEREGTIARIVRVLGERPEVDAVFGSYDTRPTAPNFVSQWKNLSHHFVHQHGAAEAQTFWAGCGAIRNSNRSVGLTTPIAALRSRTSNSATVFASMGFASCSIRRSSARTRNAGRPGAPGKQTFCIEASPGPA
ncbi:MAG: glycosyltransferase family 2 protein [Bryobacterales bacterium]|nr:glycosyltransferase family 2 protein [Bryobacterales bacterium]